MSAARRIWLTPSLAKSLLAAMHHGVANTDCSLDLGLSLERVQLSAEGAVATDGTAISAAELQKAAEFRRGVLLREDAEFEPVQVAGEQFYKLVPTDGAPTLEISGIQMHRTTGVDPFENALNCARAVIRPGVAVLDTCGGLGYTAIAAVRLGAAAVVSVEVDPNVVEIARLNPWSAEYFASSAITRVRADVAEFVASQPADSFDRVIHDPPRFSLAGELYGGEFYAHLARVLRPKGMMFHYTGEPFAVSHGRDFVAGVTRRLQAAGFSVQRAPHLQGLIARVQR